jgi:hypothetical protein
MLVKIKKKNSKNEFFLPRNRGKGFQFYIFLFHLQMQMLLGHSGWDADHTV